MGYSGLVRKYLRVYRPYEEAWFQHYKEIGSMPEAIHRATLALGPNGEKFSHQWRIPNRVLTDARSALLAAQEDIRRCGSFDELHDLVAATAGGVPGFGELAIYDTSLRVGAHLDLWPERIYLHAGTRNGFRALGGDPKAKVVAKNQLPRALHVLEPYQLEDFLCIFKDELQGKPTTRSASSCYAPSKPPQC